MWKVRIFSFLLMSAQLLITPFANEFLRRMTGLHALSFFVLFAGFACSSRIESTPEVVDSSQPPGLSMPHPVVGDDSSVEDKVDDDPWRCGFEIIVVQGPQGELIESIVPLPCDPSADIYFGCPAPMSEL